MAVSSAQRHFCIFPDSVTTVPDSSTVGAVWIDQDPIYGEYDPFYQLAIRGNVVETLGWRFTQIFPYNEGGTQRSKHRRKILLREESYSMSRASANSLVAMYANYGTKYRLYDGENIYRVWFSMDPAGFKFHKALPSWWEGRMASNPPADEFLFYNYEIILDVLQVVTTTEGLT